MNFDRIKKPEGEFVFKKLTEKDWQQYKDLRLMALSTDPEAFGGALDAELQVTDDQWKEKFNDSERYFFGAEQNQKIVSMVNAMKFKYDNWRIMGVYTQPDFRGKHLSEELIKLSINEAITKKAKKISLYVNVTQEPAISLYKKLGFNIVRLYKDEKTQGGEHMDLYYMEKDLAQ